MLRKITLLTFAIFFLVFVSCTTDDNESSNSETSTISGIASKGPIQSGTVTAYKLNSDGSLGEPLASVTTDQEGRYRMSFQYKGAVELVLNGGSYTDEATGIKIQLQTQDRLRTCLASSEGTTDVAITPLTTMARERVRARLQTQEQLQDAINNANQEVANAFGIGDVNITQTTPSNLSQAVSTGDSAKSKKYGAVLAGLSELAKTYTLTEQNCVMNMIQAMAEDISDGTMDGLKSQTQLQTSSTVMNMLQSQTTAQVSFQNTFQSSYQNSVQSFMQNQEKNKSGYSENFFASNPVMK